MRWSSRRSPVTVALFVTLGALIDSYRRYSSQNHGFAAESLTAASLRVNADASRDQARAAAQRVSGVQSVEIATALPFIGTGPRVRAALDAPKTQRCSRIT